MEIKSKYDVAVAWRIYPKISKEPLFYNNDKLSLVKLSIYSFIESAKNLKVKYYFILDGCPKEYNETINNLLKDEAYDIINTNSIGNQNTFQLQIEILLKQNESELVYFAEDDYLYKPHSFQHLINFIKSNENVDFLTGYHHKELTYHLIHKIKRNFHFRDNICWQTDASTCLTFMTKKSILRKSKNIFLTYTKGNNDCSIWLTLTKKHIYNPIKYFIFWKNKNVGFDILKMALKYGFKYFLLSKKYKLWTAVPAVCTHLEKEHISPNVDWINIYNELKNKI